MSEKESQFNIPALKEELFENQKLQKAYNRLIELIESIEPRPIPDEVKNKIQACLDIIDKEPDKPKRTLKAVNKGTNTIVKLLEKNLRLVPKNHYMVLGMSMGMVLFGIPLGVAFGSAYDNYTFISFGLPIGLSLGLAVGVHLDKKAAEQGKQLPITL